MPGANMLCPSVAQICEAFLIGLGRRIDQLPRARFSRWSHLGIDAALSLGSIWLAHELRFDFSVSARQWGVLGLWASLLTGLRPATLWALGEYRGFWRYFNLRDAATFSLAALPPTAFMLGVRLGWSDSHWIVALPKTVILMDYGVFVLFGLGVRSLRRGLYEASRRNGKPRRTLLVGTEEGLATALRQISLPRDLAVTGLLAANPELHGSRIAGFPVLGRPEALAQRLAAGGIDLVLIADADANLVGSTIATAIEFGVEARLLPSAANVIRGEVRVSATPQPERVVPRAASTTQPHPAVIAYFQGRSVLITGAGGSIGSELTRQVSRLPVSRLLLLDQDENALFEVQDELDIRTKTDVVSIVANIRDRGRIESIFAGYRPQIVLHAAAYKHVSIMEHNCSEAVLNNILGTRVVSETAVTFGAERLLLISTDKAVNPSSVMGATKRVAEVLVQHLAGNGNVSGTRFACVRFGNVVGSRGSVVPVFLRRIAHGEPLAITHAEMTRYFMTIPEAAQLTLQAATLASAGEIYVLDMGDPVKITTVARQLIEMSGLHPGKDIAIHFVGPRPGEKLHEQLWPDSAKVASSPFQRVLTVQPPPLPMDFLRYLESLEAAALTRNDDLTRAVLRSMPLDGANLPNSAVGDGGSIPQ
jgi:FlaA1/EpsC-like NDP-sugar epimerase